jgi:hypothetical protein
MNETREAFPERLFNLLTELSRDPFKLDTWLHDPAAIMKDAGLSPVESDALLGCLDRRDRAAGTVRAAFWIDPGDDPDPNPDPNQPETVCL